MELFDRRTAPKRADAWFVYGLVDSRFPDEIRYIGITNDPRRRLGHHCSQSLDPHTRKARWVAKVLREGGNVLMGLVSEGLTHAEAKSLEMDLIAESKSTLTNLTDGGDGTSGREYSDETREKIASSRRGKPLPEHVKAILREVNTGRTSPNKGKVLTPEWRANISAAGVRRMSDTLVREKIRAQGIARYTNDNERERTATATRLAGPPSNNRSGYKGVSFHSKTGKWTAQIKLQKQTFLGRFCTSEEAARAYDKAAYEAWGSDCYLNFPSAIAA